MDLYISTLQGYFTHHLYLGDGRGYYINCTSAYGMLSIEEENGSHRISYRSIISIDKTPTAYIITTKMGKINCHFEEADFSKLSNFFNILQTKVEVAKYD